MDFTTYIVIISLISYFGILFMISKFSSNGNNSNSFFTGDKKSPWYVVSFGMIGTSLSGVTFISLPGEVGASNFSYFQMVLGYLLGYFIIYTILLPIYYRLKLISIYKYLDDRFGIYSYKVSSIFFMISQLIGASFRFFLVVGVLQFAVFEKLEVPFYITCFITITLILLYTYKSGIKTVVWTDVLQTLFMLSAVVASIFILTDSLEIGVTDIFSTVSDSPHSKIFDWDWRSNGFFVKQFFAGAFMAIVMTGLDQNMMQKNLTCKTLRDSQKNMFSLSIFLVPVNLIFMSLGVLLYLYAQKHGITIPERSDFLYPEIALHHFSGVVSVIFILGIIAAAFSSADSSLTALTTAFCIDFLKLDKSTEPSKEINRKRILVHIGFAILMMWVILFFHGMSSESVLNSIFKAAGYSYGPILGLFSFAIFTKLQVRDKMVPFIAIVSPILSYIINQNSEAWFNGYKIGFEIVIINGLITFLFLLLISKKGKRQVQSKKFFDDHKDMWKNRHALK